MKRKHSELIIAWANGAEVQYSHGKNIWFNTNIPEWSDSVEYRIVPEPKPDIHTYLTVALGNTGNQTSRQYDSDSVKFTYDGETHKLKSVELLK